MKILVNAYACNPRQGSECAVGWTWLLAIKDRHDVNVLIAGNQRKWIEDEIRTKPSEFRHVQFHYVEAPLWSYVQSSRFWRWQAGKPLFVPLYHQYYRSWLRTAYRAALELNQQIHFDLVHQLTYVGFRFPGHLWKLGIPFVWGPIGGLENTPWHLLPSMGPSAAAYYAARNIGNSAHKRFLRAPRKAFARAEGGVIAATSGIRDEIMRWYGVPSQVICEVGTPMESATDHSRRSPGEPLRLAWSAQFLPGKALQLLLRALYALGNRVDWRLDIYGDGPCRDRWQSLAGRLGLMSRCTWHGQVSRDEAVRGLHRAHLFVITSLKDLTSTVTLEALSQGVPVLCPDHCGFSDVVTDECGIKLSIESTRQFQDALMRVIRELASDEIRRCQLAEGALRRAREFSWEAKAAAIDRVYQRVTGARIELDTLASAIGNDAKNSS